MGEENARTTAGGSTTRCGATALETPGFNLPRSAARVGGDLKKASKTALRMAPAPNALRARSCVAK